MAIRQTDQTFEYQGLRFKPLKKLRGDEGAFYTITRRCHDSELTPANWSYRDFYRAATEAGSGDIDVFELSGIAVIPSTNVLFEYR
ncbi:hypothetical protein [Alicyclobacillus sp. ALC3]|uniref:hypothetical protein n=1 Tax=Alicyclobacillus sp. ALC3 TaxID=2796143 RepID=UPI00237A06EB|nr:hypothetical protein [Alicyclobacillus sp. ALC3]WDL99757.1 hypothetical protein JC200_23580 [Alicyclobacillus sp. ALC3]